MNQRHANIYYASIGRKLSFLLAPKNNQKSNFINTVRRLCYSILVNFKCTFPGLFWIAKPTVLIVNPDNTAAGCRLRWGSILEINDIQKKINIALVDLEDCFGDSWLLSRILRAISTIPRLKSFCQKIRLYLRLLLFAKADLAIFGKPYGSHHMEAMKSAKRHNTKILSDFCDFHSEFNDAFLEAARYSDVITVPTAALASRIYAETSKYPIIIPDRVDYCVLPSNSVLEMLGNNSLQSKSILWFGLAFANNEPTYSFKEFCKIVSCSEDLISIHRLYVDLISESSDLAKDYLVASLSADSLIEIHSCQWSPHSMRQALSQPGFVILAYPDPVENCEKSANRIELGLYVGKVVISNGAKLSGLENSLSAYVVSLPKGSLNASDLHFEASKQYEQALETSRILDEKQGRINCLWSGVINLALG
jgi:hypothetical protein